MYAGVCPICGSFWESKDPRVFCSRECKSTSQEGAHKGGRKPLYEPVTKVCEWCQAEFLCTNVYDITKKRFCSRLCNGKSMGKAREVPKAVVKCQTCGKDIETWPCLKDSKKYCSYSCAAKGKQPEGPGNPSWRGGNSYYWKRKARERDGKCLRCGKEAKGKQLHAHHLYPAAAGGSDELSNSASLCSVCHQTVERLFYTKLIARIPAGTIESVVAEIKQELAESTAAQAPVIKE